MFLRGGADGPQDGEQLRALRGLRGFGEQTDDVRAVADHGPGVRVGHVAELPHRLLDFVPRLLRDWPVAAHDIRHGALRDTGEGGHVLR